MHTKIIQLQNRIQQPAFARLRAWGGALLLAGLFLALVTGVATAATQGYNTADGTISKGMAVAVASTGSSDNGVVSIEKTSVANADKTLGVVVDPQTDSVTYSGGRNQIYVATTGVAQVYTTDLNGSIKKGDLLAPSPMAGVLMRASNGSRGVLGAALVDFPASNTQTVTVKLPDDTSQDAKVALVQLNMDVKFSSNGSADGKSVLQRLGSAVVRREVSSGQVVVAILILTLLIVVEGAIIYGAINSSVISLGRNPLAKKTIFRGLIQISALVLLVLAVGLGSVYLVLWV